MQSNECLNHTEPPAGGSKKKSGMYVNFNWVVIKQCVCR